MRLTETRPSEPEVSTQTKISPGIGNRGLSIELDVLAVNFYRPLPLERTAGAAGAGAGRMELRNCGYTES